MPSYFEFEVSLRYIKPRIWRRFLIADDATFGDLHRAIQHSFGWFNSHLWEFQRNDRNGTQIAGAKYDDIFGFDDQDGEEAPDPESVKLASHFASAKVCRYLYDFGDSWLHDVRRNGRVSTTERFHRRLLAGRRACPPEDCGGAPGYARFVSIVETGVDPWGEDVDELIDWVGEWDPAAFDLAAQKRRFDAKTKPSPDWGVIGG